LPDIIRALPIFLLVLGAMIFVHELGHFLVAKWLGIRVEIFSLGFGKRLFGFKRGDTDYRISILPLGGYVKMAGDNIAEDRAGAPDEFLSHPKWHRFLVAVAGPVMNILTAFAIPLVASMIFFQTMEYRTKPPVVAYTTAGSPAASLLQKDDRILAVNGVEVPTWRDLEDQIMLNPDREVALKVDRAGQTLVLPVTLGSIDAGGEKIGDLGAQADLPGARIVVKAVLLDKPAAAAGMQAGDEIVAINGTPIGPWRESLIKIINDNPGNEVTIRVKRQDGQIADLKAVPYVDHDKNGKPIGRLGFEPVPVDIPMITTRLGFVDAAAYSWDTNLRFIRLTGAAFGQIFQGERKFSESLAGPIAIAQIVGQASQQGIGPVFDLMGLLSLNLGIFNLLPIPVLDGGLIFMLALEALLGFFGLQLSMGAKEKMINVGLVMIVLLMGFVIFNDIQRHIIGGKSSDPAPPPPAQTEPAPAPVVPIK
jgi:regulator of sigma E protease